MVAARRARPPPASRGRRDAAVSGGDPPLRAGRPGRRRAPSPPTHRPSRARA